MASKSKKAGGRAKTAAQRTGSGFAKLFGFIEKANRVARERRALLQLGEAELKDFGASRAEAMQEGARPWWDLPQKEQC